MPHSLSVQKARRTFAILRQHIVGIAQDFWKDGTWSTPVSASVHDEYTIQVVDSPPQEEVASSPPPPPHWHAAPGEISEKMWGKGRVTPADDEISDLLIKPLNLTKDMSVLDLSAGLGARMRRATQHFGVYVTGLEPDPDIAARGMKMSTAAGKRKKDSITAYDPMNFVDTHKYNCILARETFYRVPDKKKFIETIVKCCKSVAQISFTDYILNPEFKNQPAIMAWKAFEEGADPCSLVEMAELWAKNGISLRVHDDQTEMYMAEVKRGLIRFEKYLESSAKPDAETKKAIEKRIKTWAHRMSAMEQGLRFYRFYGQK
ncbi:MAG: methyltransferase domain-containing protein [Alphaproteobacteria bacterium]|nr:methyltransferase domain-containing protein [Alphaproteobacteria bacterium]